jgi:carboxymethylenebutenolidase
VRTKPFSFPGLLGSLLMATLLVLPASAQDWAKQKLQDSPRHLEWVSIPQGPRQLQTFVAYPEKPEKATVVLVIHEIFGLTDWVKLTCDELAQAGYIAVAPDLLSGSGPFDDVEAARKAISLLPPPQVMADLGAVASYAKGLPAGNGKLAVAGFCWGGSQTFAFAAESDAMLASFPFYGSAPEGAQVLARITRPVYGFYAENDARVNATLPATQSAMGEHGKTFEPVTYSGAGHGFMRAGVAPDASEANAKARQHAWQRWLELLGQL